MNFVGSGSLLRTGLTASSVIACLLGVGERGRRRPRPPGVQKPKFRLSNERVGLAQASGESFAVVERYGDDAMPEAAARARELMADGDLDGCTTWARIG